MTTLLGVVFTLQLHAQTAKFTYQGQLLDNDGPANGLYDLQFKIYDAVTNGIQHGLTKEVTASVTNGLFTVKLDFGADVISDENRWLEIAVRPHDNGMFTTLRSRQELTAAPFAISAGSITGPLDGAAIIAGTISGTQLANGTVTADKIADNCITANQLSESAVYSNGVNHFAAIEQVSAINDLSGTSVTNLTKLNIFIQAQSNGEMKGTPTIFPADWFNGIRGNLNVTHNGDKYIGTNKVLRAAVDNGAGWGPEVGLSMALDATIPGYTKLYFQRYGEGGQPHDHFIKGMPAYTNMLNMVTQTSSTWPGAGNPDIFILERNETDSVTLAEVQDHITNIRSDFGNSNMGFILVGRSNHATWKNFTNEVDQAYIQAAALDNKVVYVTAKQWPRRDNNTNVHFDQFGHIAKGIAEAAGVIRLMAGMEIIENLSIGRMGADVASLGEMTSAQATMGNAEVRGKLKVGELEVGDVSVANGIITGIINDNSVVIPSFYVSRYLPFESLSAVTDPINGGSYAINGDVALEFDSDRNNGVINFSTYADTNYVSMPDITLTDDWSMSLWIKEPDTTTTSYFVGKNAPTGCFTLYGGSNGAALQARMRNSTGTTNEYFTMYCPSLLNGWDDGQWHHFAIAVNYTNFQLYVDGVASTGTHVITGKPGSVPRSECVFNRLGYGIASGYNCGAKIDDFIFMPNYVINANEAASIYARQRGGDSNIKGYR